MRGEDRTSGALFSYVDVEARIGANHPLRAMRRLTNAALAGLDPRFSALYEGIGRPSIAPERLLRASLLQLLYSIRSERQLVERLEFDMLFRWFVGLTIDEKVFDASTFSKNRDRLLTHAIAQEFLSSLLGLPEVKGLLSGEHFSVDGNLLKAWASMKSFRPKSASGEGAGNGPGEPPPPGRNREADFRKTKRSNKTHASTTDKDARLYRKGAGQESRLCYLGHALMENRNGLVAAAEATLATGTAEREGRITTAPDASRPTTLQTFLPRSTPRTAISIPLPPPELPATLRLRKEGGPFHKPSSRANAIGLTSSKRARNGPAFANRRCGLSRIGSSSSLTRPEPPPR